MYNHVYGGEYMTYEETGKRIKARRKELKISAAVLAERLGLSKATIHRYENGDIKNFKMPVLESLSEVLMVNPLWLIGKSETKDGHTSYDICIQLDKLLRDLLMFDDLVCKGKPVTPELRGKMILALQILRSSLDE
jgi:transcriptional regulator with XRE-family HTH domain